MADFYNIQVRRGTAAQWAADDPVLDPGTPGLELDTGVFKLGDGVTAWTLLPAVGGTVDLTAYMTEEDTKAYADDGDRDTLTDAQTYTDNQLILIRDEIDQKIADALAAYTPTTPPVSAPSTGAQFYISENNGFPQRNAGHTAFTNIPTIVNPVKGSVLVFVYDGPAPTAGASQGFCFGAFFFDGSEWQYQTPHDAGHNAYDPPVSELDALGTAVVGAYYNGPLLPAIEAINWKAPANSYVLAWAGPRAVHLLTFHKGDGSKDREVECPYPTGVTQADMPPTKVFRSELPAAP